MGLLGGDVAPFVLFRFGGLPLAERLRLRCNLGGARGRGKRLRTLLVANGGALFLGRALNGRRRGLPLNSRMTLLDDVCQFVRQEQLAGRSIGIVLTLRKVNVIRAS